MLMRIFNSRKKILGAAVAIGAIGALATIGSGLLLEHQTTNKIFASNTMHSTALHPSHEQWSMSNTNDKYLAYGDIYRVNHGTLEILIVEDDHNTIVSYPYAEYTEYLENKQ